MNIKQGDKVLIAKGKDRGKQGKIIKILPKKDKAVVDGLNLLTKHIRPQKTGEKGKMVKVPAPIYASNLRLICSRCNKPTRIGRGIGKDGKKIRICKKCGKGT